MVHLTQTVLKLTCIAVVLFSTVNSDKNKPSSLPDGFWHPSSVDAVIRADHEYEETIGPYSYKVIYGASQKLTWIKAFQKCKSLGYNLVDLESQDEIAVVRDFLIRSASLLKSLPEGAIGNTRDGPGFWTSGSDMYTEGYYVWMSNGFNLNSDLWNPILREPSNNGNNEHCIQVNHRGSAFIINDVPCTDKLNYICKRPSDLNVGGGRSFLNSEIGLITSKIT